VRLAETHLAALGVGQNRDQHRRPHIANTIEQMPRGAGRIE
jgi:hypothetical protein